METTAARFDDLRADTAWVFAPPHRVVAARRLDEVRDVLAVVDAETRAGAWAWGHVAYEAAPALDPAMRVRPVESGSTPLVWFGLGGPPSRERAIGFARRVVDGTPDRPDWRPDWTAADHAARVERIRAAIARGDAYQVNLTTRVRATPQEDPLDLYAELVHAQGGAFNAFVDERPFRGRGPVVVSASPELFFSWDDSGITTRPMKGTARRGATAPQDEQVRAALLASEKDRAENVMIVDLLRNDLSRIARPGTVRVDSLLTAERYPTVWQLTSTVSAQPRSGTDLLDVFTALFPCGSVTGAPKVAAMRLIAEEEDAPRGVYCGAVGMVAPPGSEFRARFSVPIRTVVLDAETRHAVYGTGGGITWSSEAAQEWDELLAKAGVLDRRPLGGAELLETMRFDPGTGLRNLDRHLARVHASGVHFGVPVDLRVVRGVIDSAVEGFVDQPRRVRLLVGADGAARIEDAPFTADDPDAVVGLTLDTAVTAAGEWTRHKTTRRAHYEAATARHPDSDDVVLVDADGFVMETTRANLVVRSGDQWCTPPLTRGCLPGVERQRLLDAGVLVERDIRSEELTTASELAVVSSLRGWRRARLYARAATRSAD
ncbi:aminodeoxychorismate synthase component I [Jatrophihabitans sp. YIM 134969]